jgi:tetratricopeptide (TPR) repeat protein
VEDNTNLILNGIELSSQGRFEEAIQCYDQALAINPNDKEGWDGKGDALDDLGKHEEAIICYDYVLRIHPNDSTWAMKGIVLNKINRHQEASICFDKALAMNPQNTTALTMKKNNQEGKELSEDIEIMQKSIDMREKIIQLFDSKKYEEAIPHIHEAMKLLECVPAIAKVSGSRFTRFLDCFLTQCYAETHRFQEALDFINLKIRIDPSHAHYWNSKGGVLNAQSKYEEALICYHKALEINPESWQDLKNIGENLDKLSKYPESISYYQRALEKDPNNEKIQKDLDSVKAKLSKDSPSKTVEKIEVIEKNELSDPVIILKVRLAKGEITLEEYRKIKEHLEN